jgi:hypothetical protein
MSINLHLFAKYQLKSGRMTGMEFNLWQTPTNVTARIVDSSDIRKAYGEWCAEICDDSVSVAEHLRELDQWIEVWKEDATIVWEVA